MWSSLHLSFGCGCHLDGKEQGWAASTQPRQPWLLFQGSSCCLATTQSWWLFVYPSSWAKRSSHLEFLHLTIIAFNIRAASDGSESTLSCSSSFSKAVFVKYTHTPTNSMPGQSEKYINMWIVIFCNIYPLRATSMDKVISDFTFNDVTFKWWCH